MLNKSIIVEYYDFSLNSLNDEKSQVVKRDSGQTAENKLEILIRC